MDLVVLSFNQEKIENIPLFRKKGNKIDIFFVLANKSNAYKIKPCYTKLYRFGRACYDI